MLEQMNRMVHTSGSSLGGIKEEEEEEEVEEEEEPSHGGCSSPSPGVALNRGSSLPSTVAALCPAFTFSLKAVRSTGRSTAGWVGGENEVGVVPYCSHAHSPVLVSGFKIFMTVFPWSSLLKNVS